MSITLSRPPSSRVITSEDAPTMRGSLAIVESPRVPRQRLNEDLLLGCDKGLTTLRRHLVGRVFRRHSFCDVSRTTSLP